MSNTAMSQCLTQKEPVRYTNKLTKRPTDTKLQRILAVDKKIRQHITRKPTAVSFVTGEFARFRGEIASWKKTEICTSPSLRSTHIATRPESIAPPMHALSSSCTDLWLYRSCIPTDPEGLRNFRKVKERTETGRREGGVRRGWHHLQN